MVLSEKVLRISCYHVPIAAIHHKSVGLQDARDLFMIDAIGNIWPGPDDRGRSEEFGRVSGEFNRAEQVRSLGPRRSAGTISGWRFPRDLAGNLCAVRDDRCADTARRIEILERRSAGGICG